MNLHLIVSPGVAPDVAYPWWLILVAPVVAVALIVGTALLLKRFLRDDVDAELALFIAVIIGIVGGLLLGWWGASVTYQAAAADARADWSKDASAYLSEKYATPVSPADAVQLAANDGVTAIVRGRITDIHLVEVSGDQLVLATWKIGDGYTEVPHRTAEHR